ncbi:hypothetical protein RJ639_034742 [Escallonia herrerae]|uniref:PUM-HD domain-containing protein n=1 Tax=Escallonia herrerae TaxID=1293975 RepID=A0AA89BGB7_9ASTE|nr:hypothetical protein RJ639_034742 [Escallonia herrerae]
MRLVEISGSRKWPSSRDAAMFASPLINMPADELGWLLERHQLSGDQRNKVPNRSGSAPPSIEGSLTAFRNLVAKQTSSLSSSTTLGSLLENYQSEEQLRADPSYFAYYCSNVNLNPRLPPPILSRENRHLSRHTVGLTNNGRSMSFDDGGSGSLLLSKGSLSTHNEEPEYDKSPPEAPGPNAVPSAGRHKSLVDLIQEDFPRTPSPVYNQSHSPTYAAAQEPINLDIQPISLDDLSINLSDSRSGAIGLYAETDTEGLNARIIKANSDSLVSLLPEDSNSDKMGSSSPQKAKVVGKDVGLADDVESDASNSLYTEEDGRNKQEQQFVQQQQGQHSYSHPRTSYQIQGSQSQVIVQGVNHTHHGTEKDPHGRPVLSSAEVQPVLRPPGIAPPLYATTAAYMTSSPFYSTVNPSGLYAAQYVGGYAMNTFPPFIAGYPSQTAMRMHLDASSVHCFNGQTASVLTGESIPHVGNLHHLNKFYAQQGLIVQPSYLDPIPMHYFSHPSADTHAAARQYGQLTSMGVVGFQGDSFDAPRGSSVVSYTGDTKFLPAPKGNFSIPGTRAGEIPSSYYGSPRSVGVLTQFSASPLGSPLLPGSPVGITNHLGRRNEMSFPQYSIRNVGLYSGWQGQQGSDSFNDPKKHLFLEELRSSNARKFNLSDIAGRIIEFSVDQHGSRFIQQKLESCDVEDKVSVFKEVLPHALKLMTDVFGNYVIQKFFEHGSGEQRKELADQLSGQMLTLCMQMYGCRVIQKALEVIELEQKMQLVHELDGHVIRCVRDQNGNHVIQKCIECIPVEKIGFVISAFRGQVAILSTHPYGCRVIQRILEHCSDESQSHCIVDEILESAYSLAQDQYGNYVTQHVLERGKAHERSQIISKLTGKVVEMSQHKYASNVVEKCLEHGDIAERELLIDEILGQSEENDNLLVMGFWLESVGWLLDLAAGIIAFEFEMHSAGNPEFYSLVLSLFYKTMMKDQFANYVVQKIFEKSNDKQREVLLSRTRVHLLALKKYTYGKHIVARFEQLSGEGVCSICFRLFSTLFKCISPSSFSS